MTNCIPGMHHAAHHAARHVEWWVTPLAIFGFLFMMVAIALVFILVMTPLPKEQS